jgi:hypothetical protein
MGTRGVGMLGDNAMRWFHVRDRSSHAGIARDRSHALLLQGVHVVWLIAS